MSRHLLVLAGSAIVGLAACSSSTEPVGNTLTAVDARRAASAFASIGSGGRETLMLVDSVTSACPQGGTVRSTMLSSGLSTTRGAVVVANCAVADSAGELWTFTSLPRLELSVTATISDSTLSSVSTVRGAMRVESSTVRGTCSTNTRVETVLRLRAGGTVRIRQTGQVCGQTIDTTLTVPVPQ
jgi:hypothetical protein